MDTDAALPQQLGQCIFDLSGIYELSVFFIPVLSGKKRRWYNPASMAKSGTVLF